MTHLAALSGAAAGERGQTVALPACCPNSHAVGRAPGPCTPHPGHQVTPAAHGNYRVHHISRADSTSQSDVQEAGGLFSKLLTPALPVSRWMRRRFSCRGGRDTSLTSSAQALRARWSTRIPWKWDVCSALMPRLAEPSVCWWNRINHSGVPGNRLSEAPQRWCTD